MIRVIERNPDYNNKIERHLVICYNCKSKFECDDTDFHRVIVSHGMSQPGVTCPVCNRECTGWNGTDQISVIEDA